MPKYKVLYTDTCFPDTSIESAELAAIDAELIVAPATDQDSLIAAGKDCDGVIFDFAPMTDRVLSNLPKCKVASRVGIGLNNIDIPAASRNGIMVANVPDYCFEEVANHAVALYLACNRRLTQYDHRIKDQGNWDVTGVGPIYRMTGQNFCLYGLGNIARRVVKRVKPAKLKAMCETDSHQGVAAWASQIEYATLEQLLDSAAQKGEPPFLVLADGVEDPHNLGAILRSALLCGAHGVVIPKRGGVGITGTVLKASAGAATRLPVARVANIGEAIRRLKEQNVFVYCADMDGVSLHKNNLTGPIALVMGAEGKGVSPLVKRLCDGVVRLDMAAQGTGVDSFNVSVAAGIILYEISRQRSQQ